MQVVLMNIVYKNLHWLHCEECIWLTKHREDNWELHCHWKDQVYRYNTLGRKEGILEYRLEANDGISRNLKRLWH